MSDFRIQITPEEVLEALRSAHTRLMPRLGVAVGRGVARIAGQARELVSGKVLRVRTGRLRSSIMPSGPQVKGARVFGEVGTNVEYAPPHELGLEIQVPEIRPKRAKALRFEIGGKVVFAKRVRAHVIRMPRRPFLGRAADEEQGWVLDQMAGAVVEAFEA